MFSWLSHVPLTFSKAGQRSPSCEKKNVPDDTNPMMDCSFYGVREVSESQNKQGVKISTLGIKNWGPQQQPQLAGGKGAATSALARRSMKFLYTTKSQVKIPSDLHDFTSGAPNDDQLSPVLSSGLILKASLSRDQKSTPKPPVSYSSSMRTANRTRKGPEHWWNSFGNNIIL